MLATELGLPADQLGFVVVYVSRISSRKHPEDLAEAVRQLGPDAGVRAVFVGGGDSEPLTKAAAGLANVHVLGHRPNPAQFFAAADVFSLPSRNEPFGLAAVEAMAAGTPVVLPNAGGFQEIGDDGRTGYLYDVESPVTGLVEALVKLKNDPELARAMGARAIIDATERFAADAMVERTIDYYREVSSSPLSPSAT